MSTTKHPSLEAQQHFWNWHWQHWKERRTINGWKDQRHEIVVNFLSSLALDHPKILDLGCGPGWYTRKFARFGQVTGVDLSDEAIAKARARFPEITFLAGNLFELPLPVKHYDVVVSQEVIDHVEDRVAFLDRAAELLKPEGYLMLVCGNQFVLDRLSEAAQPPQPPDHIGEYLSVREWKRVLRSKYKVLKIMTIIPRGDRGILRVINSYKLNTVMGFFFGQHRLEALKEWAGFGYTIIIFAQKKT